MGLPQPWTAQVTSAVCVPSEPMTLGEGPPDLSGAAGRRSVLPRSPRAHPYAEISGALGRGACPWITSNLVVFVGTSTSPSRRTRSREPPPARRLWIVTAGSQSGSDGLTYSREPVASVVAWMPARIAISRITEPAAHAWGTLAPGYWTGKLVCVAWGPAKSSGRR